MTCHRKGALHSYKEDRKHGLGIRSFTRSPLSKESISSTRQSSFSFAACFAAIFSWMAALKAFKRSAPCSQGERLLRIPSKFTEQEAPIQSYRGNKNLHNLHYQDSNTSLFTTLGTLRFGRWNGRAAGRGIFIKPFLELIKLPFGLSILIFI